MGKEQRYTWKQFYNPKRGRRFAEQRCQNKTKFCWLKGWQHSISDLHSCSSQFLAFLSPYHLAAIAADQRSRISELILLLKSEWNDELQALPNTPCFSAYEQSLPTVPDFPTFSRLSPLHKLGSCYRTRKWLWQGEGRLVWLALGLYATQTAWENVMLLSVHVVIKVNNEFSVYHCPDHF